MRQSLRSDSKALQPRRIKGQMKRTNPKKRVDEDPQFVEISWQEAIEASTNKPLKVRRKGLLDENGVAFGEGEDLHRVAPREPYLSCLADPPPLSGIRNVYGAS